MIFEFFVLAFTIYVMLSTIGKLRRQRISFIQASVWILFWALVLIVLIFPDVLNYIADFVGIGRGVDVVIYLSILFLFFIIFKQSIKIRQLSQHIVKMTSAYAVMFPERKDFEKKDR